MDYLFTFFFLISAHYFQWDRVLPWKLPHPVRIIQNYVIGTVGMLLPYCIRLYRRGDIAGIWEVVSFVFVAGLAPAVAYIYDSLVASRDRARESEEREQLVMDEHAKNQGL